MELFYCDLQFTSYYPPPRWIYHQQRNHSYNEHARISYAHIKHIHVYYRYLQKTKIRLLSCFVLRVYKIYEQIHLRVYIIF